MNKNPRVLFFTVIVVTILAILIDLPKSLPVSFQIPKLPFMQKNISVSTTIKGFNADFFLAPFNKRTNLVFHKGLDLEGGTSIILKADMSSVSQNQRGEALDSVKAVIERRVNFYGVSEPIVQTATGNQEYRIIVELPGVTDVNQAISLIGTTAQLSFWEDDTHFATPSAATLPLGITSVFPHPHKTTLTGNDLQQASVTFDQNSGSPQVQLLFTSDGAQKFEEITKRNINKRVAIALDNQIVEAPTVNQAISGGNAVITGGFTTDQAKALRIQLNAGALPVPLSILQQHTIGATLGVSSLAKSLFAGVLGFIIIVVFMSILYGRLGVLASIALLLYTFFVLALFKIVPVTLTLAGIAGFILSIGMAVDANILIFERMKEELRRGKSRDVAIELGFSRAWTSIKDSNISSLITSAILYYFGTGIVRGFALTLAIGVLVSMFSAIVVTRTFLRMAYK